MKDNEGTWWSMIAALVIVVGGGLYFAHTLGPNNHLGPTASIPSTTGTSSR